jgi:hypothetical protein
VETEIEGGLAMKIFLYVLAALCSVSLAPSPAAASKGVFEDLVGRRIFVAVDWMSRSVQLKVLGNPQGYSDAQLEERFLVAILHAGAGSCRMAPHGRTVSADGQLTGALDCPWFHEGHGQVLVASSR